VYTGDKRSAGTTSNVFIALEGSKDRTEEQCLLGGKFERNSVDRFVIDAPYDLGEIRSVIVGSDDTGPSSGWFLDKVEVNGRSFFCKNWIGTDENGKVAPHAHVLSPFEMLAKKRHARSPSLSTEKVFLQVSARAVPRQDRLHNGVRAYMHRDHGWAGEDAYFAVGDNSLNPAMGVADGVSQWEDKGIDAGQFSRTLMKNARNIVKSLTYESIVRPLDVLKESYARVKEKRIEGSCTACILTLDRSEKLLRAANLGDSGYIVLGEWDTHSRPQIIYKSLPQEHFFGYPYQLGHHTHSDSPDDAEKSKVHVREYDLVILGTDGLLDNVSVNEMMSIAQDVASDKRLSRQEQLQTLTFKLRAAAYDNSISRDISTPYSEAASDEFQLVYRGGKRDDITVIAGFVSRSPNRG